MSTATIWPGIEVDMEQERADAKARRQARFNEGMRGIRAQEVVEAAAPAVGAKAFIRAARKAYSRLLWSERKKIVQMAIDLAADPNRAGRAGRPRQSLDPLRAKPRPRRGPKKVAAAPAPRVLITPPPAPEPVAAVAVAPEPREEPVIAPAAQETERQAPRQQGRPSTRDQYREPVRAVIAPLLEEEPTLTATEGFEAVKAAGIEVRESTWKRLWLEYLAEHGLDSRELTRARRQRGARAGWEKSTRKRRTRTKAAPADGMRVAAAAEVMAAAAATDPTKRGVQLIMAEGGACRIVVDALVAPAHAYTTLGAIAMALDLAREEAA